MAGLVPAIYVSAPGNVDARHEAGHDVESCAFPHWHHRLSLHMMPIIIFAKDAVP
jgi:hypothetical protein